MSEIWREPIVGKRITYKYLQESRHFENREHKGLVLSDTETFICIFAGLMIDANTSETQEVTEMIMRKDFFIIDIEELSNEELLTHESETVRKYGRSLSLESV